MKDKGRNMCGKAFSLIELLSVMSVLSLLAVATLPALRGSLEGLNISGAADTLGADLALARQTAMTRNIPVEVRLYKHDDGTGEAWRALGIVIPEGAGGDAGNEWIVAGRVLPGNVVMEDTASYSTILSQTVGAAPQTGQESSDAPRLLREKTYVAFRFNPDGSTNLPTRDGSNGAQHWCLTLRNANSKPVSGAPAANYAAFVLDPLTGRASLYQP